MQVIVFEIEAHERALFDALKSQGDVELVRQPLQSDNAGEFADADAISTFIYSNLGRDTLERLPRLKLIATRSTGFDHIDIAYCTERGITVSNVPHYGEATVAEHVFALLLTISHRMREAMDRARNGEFSPRGLEGFDLESKTIGVVGTGGIGRHVIRIARGFGMEVIACDQRPDQSIADKLGFRYATLDEVLSRADVVTLHVPATPETHNLISQPEISRMKDSVILINTARGSLIDTRALIQALTKGKIAAAGLDVLPDEPAIREEAELICSFFCDQHDLRNLVAGHVLLRMPNVFVTPHSAFNTKEAVGRIAETTVGNIKAFINGRPLNVVAGPIAVT